MVSSGANGIMLWLTKLLLAELTKIKCGLIKFGLCTEDFVISLPVQLISFAKYYNISPLI